MSKSVKGPAISKNRTVEYQIEQYLALLRPRLKVKSYKEIQLFLPGLVKIIGNDIDAINEESVKVFWSHRAWAEQPEETDGLLPPLRPLPLGT